MYLRQTTLEIDNEKIVCEALIREDNVVILHGAGASSRKRFQPLANAIVQRGKGVILFDFSSHGDSTGKREELSLERRATQAREVIDTLLPKEGELYLAGFSMSGQTICDLLPLYKGRVPAILLGCPAVYSHEVRDLRFDGGEFSSRIRVENSWKDSQAFNELRNFEGKTVIAIGKEDQIIPKEVVESLKVATKQLSYVEYPGVDHQLAVWLAAHEQEQGELLDLLFS